MHRRNAPRLMMVCLAAMLLSLAVAPVASGAGWTWKSKGRIVGNIGSLDEVQCPSLGLCVAAGGQAVYVTTTPKGLARVWRKVNISQVGALGRSYIFELSCPTTTFCVAGDDQSNVMITTKPSGQASDWNPRRLPSDTYVGVRGLSCGSVTLCAVTDVSGYAMTTTSPESANYTRSRLSTVLNASLYDLSCAGLVCASVEAGQHIWVTADASVQPAVWTKLRIGTAARRLNTVSCATATLCVAAGSGNVIRVSTNPTGPASSWRAVALPRTVTGIDHATCRPGLCMLTSGTAVWWSTTPAVARSWQRSDDRTRRVILSDTSCPNPRTCVLIDVGNHVWVGTR